MGKTTTSEAGGDEGPATGTSEGIETCKKCKRWQEVKQRMRVAQFIGKTVDKVEGKRGH
jgi:hypothetical protein